MKKRLSLLLALCLILTLFAACDSSTPSSPTATTASTAAPTSAAQTQAPSQTEAPTETEEPADTGDNLAAGKYELNARGLPTSDFVYDLPLTSSDQVYSYWTTIFSPEAMKEDSLAEMPFQAELEARTGVIVEYLIVTGNEARQTNFSVLLASNDLPDMMGQAVAFYPGTIRNGISEGYFANLYDYKDYMPNYLYQITRFETNMDLYNTIFLDDVTIPYIMSMIEEPMPGSGYCVREDWLDTLGIDPASVTTYDEIYDMLSRFKNELDVQWPMAIFSGIEVASATFASGFDTSAMYSALSLPLARVVDGNVEFTLVNEGNRDCMALINKWFSEGLIDPNWTTYDNTTLMNQPLTNDVIGYSLFSPSELGALEATSIDPNTRWTALKRPRLSEDQQLKYGQKMVHFGYGSVCMSADADNIPLLVSWWDYQYSVEGSLFCSWGVEGLTWDYDTDGNRMLTDFVLNNPDGVAAAWLMLLYANNALADPCLQHHLRVYAYPGGERYVSCMKDIWFEPDYKNEYDGPSNWKFTEEEQNEVNSFQADIITFLGESYLAFVDGSLPMSEWDSYVASAYDMGLARCTEIYQQAYDRLT